MLATLAIAAMPAAEGAEPVVPVEAAPVAAVAVPSILKTQTFTLFATEFSLNEKVLTLLLKSTMENLDDLRYWFSTEAEVDSFITEDDSLKGHDMKLQVSRLRCGWQSLRKSALLKESRNSASTVADLDDLLCDTDLRGVKLNFWRRYKLKYPTEIYPCDQIISRCYRELEKRMLTVYDMWKVKSLKHQVTTSNKRRKVADGLFTIEEEAVAQPTYNVEGYLARLHIYLLALAITGSTKKQGATDGESFGTESTDYIAAPWDTLAAYYFRAVEAAAAIPEGSRLAWLERCDSAERSVWVSSF